MEIAGMSDACLVYVCLFLYKQVHTHTYADTRCTGKGGRFMLEISQKRRAHLKLQTKWWCPFFSSSLSRAALSRAFEKAAGARMAFEMRVHGEKRREISQGGCFFAYISCIFMLQFLSGVFRARWIIEVSFRSDNEVRRLQNEFNEQFVVLCLQSRWV